MLSGKKLFVEIHDVSPRTKKAVWTIDRHLAKAGVLNPTMLVVPMLQDGHARRWDLRHDEQLVAWLQKRQAQGSQMIQHGLTHRANRAPQGLQNAFMHYCFSMGRAEFAHLDFHNATQRLVVGKNILSACGLNVQGFIAPAWQQSQPSIQAQADLGYRYTAFFNKVVPLQSEPIKSPVLTFDAPWDLLARSKRRMMQVIESLSQNAKLLRIALHPRDAKRPCLLSWIVGCIQRLGANRQITNYAECFS